MKFKVLKTGLWAIDPPNPGEYHITKEEVVDDIPERLIPIMLEKGSIEPVVGQSRIDNVGAFLWEMVENSPNRKEAKKALEKWGKETLDCDIDHRNRPSKIIDNLIKEYLKQNG